MSLAAYLLLGAVLAAAIANHIRLTRALARTETLYAVLYGFKYRIREVEDEVKSSVDALRYEINPAAAPQAGGCGSGGCGSHGHGDDHAHGASETALPAGQFLQIT
jgi:hypothetical protein